MKILILTLWCLCPLGLLAYHYGPGREGLRLDAADALLDQAQASTQSGDPKAAVAAFEASLAKLPKDRVAEARRIRLELAKARMESSELPKAREELVVLAEEMEKDPDADPLVRDEALATLATSRYYMTYLMKLEGLPDTDWEPEIEAARQERKLLVERAEAAGDAQAVARHSDDLESAIRLARTEPEELYGKAIPKPCNCKSGKCKPNNKVGKKKTEDARGASAGPPVDGSGS
ncbi:putative negative regulator of RcsB-dependent stress response [Haloferula luteola]|uniref:Putative negative regulator of RcsB-dependent stress response n=1 Tax=Haloferula luteola TaxID=595692 RepID=A0A840VDK0_9BACT|nr:tetratricopeptide repeat protein [Haloferula luteola]MBB5352708.1 putative negative regulator of RcsB-dependent stress response [Haloferula luteola]